MQITLQNGFCSAVADTQGGELVSFRGGEGEEYLWNGDPAYWSGRNPILFPIVGGLKNGCVRFRGAGGEYKIPRHGFARRSGFSLAEQGKDYVVLELRESAETLAQYPFAFALRVRHQLLEDGFSTRFEVENTGERSLPFCIGAHTAFRCPLHEGERFEDYQLVFAETERADVIPLTPEDCLSHDRREPGLRDTDRLPLRYSDFDRLDTLTFDCLRSKVVSLVRRDTGQGLQVGFEGFPMLAFWTKPYANAPFLCIEPWHGCDAYDNESGFFEDKPYCIQLPPKERRSLEYRCKVIPAYRSIDRPGLPRASAAF